MVRPMFAADPPAIVQPTVDDSQGVIEVIATRPGQAQKIDRRTYRVKQNTQSAQFNAIELMRGLPAVTITPDDQIMLLGASGVTFLVDERPVRGNPILYLRTRHGSDIERIEIMTNPSAQYGSGTGGIINIVLRKQRDDGVTGSGNVELVSLGRVESSTTIKKKSGKVSYEFQVQGTAGRSDEWTHHKLRAVQQVEGGPSTINREDGGGHTSQNTGYVNGKISYEASPRTTVSGGTFAGFGRGPSRSHADFVGVTPDFEAFSERRRSDFKVFWVGVDLSFDRKGRKDGESLKGSAGLFGNPVVREPVSSEFGAGRTYSTLLDRKTLYSFAKLDWVHHPGKDEILSIGGNTSANRNDRVYSFESNDPLRYGPDFRDAYDVKETTLSGYVTFQKMFGKFTVMPGLRYEASGGRSRARGVRPAVMIDRTCRRRFTLSAR